MPKNTKRSKRDKKKKNELPKVEENIQAINK